MLVAALNPRKPSFSRIVERYAPPVVRMAPQHEIDAMHCSILETVRASLKEYAEPLQVDGHTGRSFARAAWSDYGQETPDSRGRLNDQLDSERCERSTGKCISSALTTPRHMTRLTKSRPTPDAFCYHFVTTQNQIFQAGRHIATLIREHLAVIIKGGPDR